MSLCYHRKVLCKSRGNPSSKILSSTHPCMRYAGWMSRSTNALTFPSMLQNAACRAWSRCMSGVAQQSPPDPSTASDNADAPSRMRSSGLSVTPVDRQPKGVFKLYESDARSSAHLLSMKLPELHHLAPFNEHSYINPNTLTRYDMKPFDPGRSTDTNTIWRDEEDWMFTPCCWGDPFVYSLPKSPTSKPPNFLTPITSHKQLYNTLVLLRSPYTSPKATLPQLLDYYQFNREFWSTRSFNYLISLSLQHASFGVTTRLLETMSRANLSPNLETQKLYIRLMVQTGQWDAAWEQFTSAGSEKETSGLGTLHETLWLEFFRSSKQGAIRKRGMSKGVRHDSEYGEYEDYTFVLAQRYLKLMQHRPSLTLEEARPRVLYFVTHALLQLRRQEHALSLTKFYLSNLPVHLDRRHAVACLNIIHLFLVFGSSQKGIQRFQENRRILMALFSSHPSLKPTSATLFLLLSSLRSTKRCGTLAFQTLVDFKRRWGAQVEDQQVRRRISKLALKEGRHDIVKMMFGQERTSGRTSGLTPPPHHASMWTNIAAVKTFLPLPPKRKGPNAVKRLYLWRELRWTRRRKIQRRKRLLNLRQNNNTAMNV
ncbi:hypothetical protein K435DRAFT_265872 [Dendrothele bispora CBS 962.96]|uniref:Uncharacterized protein n=1 Tax=Dendrothele bispora (strain CBS 962.96) TaxID=1314807 RepID=A0A4S8MX87_DENBC|nr:hypothetical protein K435DRAFT_265872 [Dendrothele bispora CBS 962.96]